MKLSLSGEIRPSVLQDCPYVSPALTRTIPHMVSPGRVPLQTAHIYACNIAAVNLKLAQKFYSARLVELRDLIAAEEVKFK
jgi:hypothetical protein